MRRQSNFVPGFKAVGPGGAAATPAVSNPASSSSSRKSLGYGFSRARTYSVEFGRSLSHYIKASAKATMPDKWYVVDPRRSLVVGWDFYMVVLLLFTIIVTPFEVCFLSSDLIPTWLLVVNYFVDSSFFTDLLLNFNRMTFDETTGIPVSDVKILRKQYLRGYFFVDFVSCLPFDQLAILFGAGEADGEALKILRLLKLVRLAKLIKMINSQELMQVGRTPAQQMNLEELADPSTLLPHFCFDRRDDRRGPRSFSSSGTARGGFCASSLSPCSSRTSWRAAGTWSPGSRSPTLMASRTFSRWTKTGISPT